MPQGLIRAARKSGQLNLSGRSLSEGELGAGGDAVLPRRPLCLAVTPLLPRTSVALSRVCRLAGGGRAAAEGRGRAAALVPRPRLSGKTHGSSAEGTGAVFAGGC